MLVSLTDRHTTTASRSPQRARLRHAGLGFVAAWVVGLAVHPGGVTSADRAQDVASHYATHRGAALAQAGLVHGVAALAVAVFAGGLAAVAADRGRARLAAAARKGGSAAAALSALQTIADVTMIAGAGHLAPSTTHLLLACVERLDAAKLLALGVVVWAGVCLARDGALPRWTGRVATALLACLAVATVGLGGGLRGLATAAVPGLVLLLGWVGGVAWTASRPVA